MAFRSISPADFQRVRRSCIHDRTEQLSHALGMTGGAIRDALGPSGFLACYGSDGRGESADDRPDSVQLVAYRDGAGDGALEEIFGKICGLKKTVREILADDRRRPPMVDTEGDDYVPGMEWDLARPLRETNRLTEQELIVKTPAGNLYEFVPKKRSGDKKPPRPIVRPDHLLDARCLVGNESDLRGVRRKMLVQFFRTSEIGRANLSAFRSVVRAYLDGETLAGENERRSAGRHYDLDSGEVFFGKGRSGFKYGPLRAIQSWLIFRYLMFVQENGHDTVDQFSRTEGPGAMIDARFDFLKERPDVLGLSLEDVRELAAIYDHFWRLQVAVKVGASEREAARRPHPPEHAMGPGTHSRLVDKVLGLPDPVPDARHFSSVIADGFVLTPDVLEASRAKIARLRELMAAMAR